MGFLQEQARLLFFSVSFFIRLILLISSFLVTFFKTLPRLFFCLHAPFLILSLKPGISLPAGSWMCFPLVAPPPRAGVACTPRRHLGTFVLWFVCSVESGGREWGVGGSSVCRWGEEREASLLSSVGQEELAVLRRQLEGKDGEMRRLQDETGFKAMASSSADPSDRGGGISGRSDQHDVKTL